MFNSAKIEKLTQEAAAAVARAEAAETELAALKASIEQAAGIAAAAAAEGDEGEEVAEGDKEEETAESGDAVATISESVETLSARISSLETANAELDKSIEAKVSSTLAAMGIDPIARAAAHVDGTVEREDLSNLRGSKRLAAASKVKK